VTQPYADPMYRQDDEGYFHKAGLTFFRYELEPPVSLNGPYSTRVENTAFSENEPSMALDGTWWLDCPVCGRRVEPGHHCGG